MMTIASAMVLWPVRFATTSYALRATINGTSTTRAFPLTGSLTVGRNYWMSGDGQADADGGVGGVGDLLAMLAASLPGLTVSFGTGFVVSVEAATHADSFSILWDNVATTLDESVFGFADAATASSYATLGTMVPQGIWRPERPPTEDSRNRQPIVGAVGVTLSGLQRTSRLVAPKQTRDITFTLLPAEKSLAEYETAGDPTGSFERMLTESLSYGRPVRVYDDESVRTSSSYGLYVPRETDPVKQLARDPDFLIRWRASLPLRRLD